MPIHLADVMGRLSRRIRPISETTIEMWRREGRRLKGRGRQLITEIREGYNVLAFYFVLVDGSVDDGGGVGQFGEQPLLGAGSAPAPAAPTRRHAAPSPGIGVVMVAVVMGMGRHCSLNMKRLF